MKNKELNIWCEFLNLFFKAILFAALFWGLFFLFSCNTTKHTTSSQTKIDSSASTGKTTNTESTNTSGSKSEDNYEESTMTYYNYDTVNKIHYIDSAITIRKGKLTIQDTQVIHVTQKVFDTTHIQIIAESKADTKDKTSESAFKIPALAWWGLGILGIIIILVIRAFKSLKNKTPIGVVSDKIIDKMDGDS